MDRPTHNSLIYLTKVSGHKIIRDPALRDLYVAAAMTDLYGPKSIESYLDLHEIIL